MTVAELISQLQALDKPDSQVEIELIVNGMPIEGFTEEGKKILLEPSCALMRAEY